MYVQLIMSVCSDKGAKWIFVGSFICSIICRKSFLSNGVDGTGCGDVSNVGATGGRIVVLVGCITGGTVCVEGHGTGTGTCVGGAVRAGVECTEVRESVVLESRLIRLDDNVDDDADE